MANPFVPEETFLLGPSEQQLQDWQNRNVGRKPEVLRQWEEDFKFYQAQAERRGFANPWHMVASDDAQAQRPPQMQRAQDKAVDGITRFVSDVAAPRRDQAAAASDNPSARPEDAIGATARTALPPGAASESGKPARQEAGLDPKTHADIRFAKVGFPTLIGRHTAMPSHGLDTEPARPAQSAPDKPDAAPSNAPQDRQTPTAQDDQPRQDRAAMTVSSRNEAADPWPLGGRNTPLTDQAGTSERMQVNAAFLPSTEFEKWILDELLGESQPEKPRAVIVDTEDGEYILLNPDMDGMVGQKRIVTEIRKGLARLVARMDPNQKDYANGLTPPGKNDPVRGENDPAYLRAQAKYPRLGSVVSIRYPNGTTIEAWDRKRDKRLYVGGQKSLTIDADKAEELGLGDWMPFKRSDLKIPDTPIPTQLPKVFVPKAKGKIARAIERFIYALQKSWPDALELWGRLDASDRQEAIQKLYTPSPTRFREDNG